MDNFKVAAYLRLSKEEFGNEKESISSKRFKIKCTLRYHIRWLLKLYIIEQIHKRNIWD